MWDPKRIADPRFFLDRHAELDALRQRIEKRDNLLVYGQRRLGKTSLLRRVAQDARATFLFVECNFCDSEESLGQQVLAAVRGTGLARRKQFLDWAREAANGLEIGIEVTETTVIPFLRRGTSRPRPLEDVLEFATRIARVSGQPLVLVLDEFQAVITDFPEAIAKLRAHAQSQDEVSYVLAGSRPTILLGLTRHKNPFWRQLTEFPLGPIDVPQALADAQRLLGHPIPQAAQQRMADFTKGNTQRLAELLEILGQAPFTAEAVEDAIVVLLGRHSASFERMLGQLTGPQRRLCIALAIHRPAHPTGARFVQEAGLGTPSHVQRSLAALERHEILDDERRFVDPAFAAWLARSDPMRA